MSARLRHGGTWLLAVLGALALAVAVAVPLAGLTTAVVRSDSMTPALSAGDLVVARTIDAADARVGDVVTVVGDQGRRLTHRVVSIDPVDGGAALTLKGDANVAADREVHLASTVDRQVIAIPLAGYAVAALASPLAALAGGLVAFGGVVVAIRSFARAPGRAGRARVTLVAATVVALVGATATIVAPAGHTYAAFSDRATLTTGTFAQPEEAVTGYGSCTAEFNGTTYPCEISGMRAKQWTNGTHVFRDYYVTIVRTGDIPYGAIPTVTVDLSKLDPANLDYDSGAEGSVWPDSWEKAATIHTGQFTPPADFACSSLPVVTASGPEWLLNPDTEEWIRVLADRSGTHYETLNCAY